MAVYSVNQNRQFYVLDTQLAADSVNVSNLTKGQAKMGTTADGQFFFTHMGEGGLTRTDLIDKDKVCYVTVTPKESMRRYPKKATVVLNPNVNEGKLISGQDYILRIQINNYLSPSDASVLIKVGAVHAYAGMTAEAFYKKMAEVLTKSFSRDASVLLTFKGASTGLTITENPDQPWRLGVLSQEPVNFNVFADTVKYNGDEVIWAKTNEDTGLIDVTEDTASTAVGNGTKIADLEYFCMAERGDMFRNMGWPNNIDVKYMVDPTREYDVLDLHYYYSGDGVQVHKSEKDITFVSSTSGVISGLATKLKGLGLTVKTVGTDIGQSE